MGRKKYSKELKAQTQNDQQIFQLKKQKLNRCILGHILIHFRKIEVHGAEQILVDYLELVELLP